MEQGREIKELQVTLRLFFVTGNRSQVLGISVLLLLPVTCCLYTVYMHLQNITSHKGGISLFDFDHSGWWFERFGLLPDVQEDIQLLNELYTLSNQIFTPEVTGIILGPDFGWHVLHTKPADVGVVFRLEQSDDQPDPLANPRLNTSWTIEHIRNNYGIVKLELHYHPDEPNALQKRKFVAELYEYSHYEEVDFILDLKVKTHTLLISNPEEFQNAQLIAIKHLRQTCDAMMLEVPQDALAAATITAELDIPWLMTSSIFDTYEACKETVRMVVENGARGTVLNQVLLADTLNDIAISAENFDQIKQELTTTVRDRVLEIRRIVDEGVELSS